MQPDAQPTNQRINHTTAVLQPNAQPTNRRIRCKCYKPGQHAQEQIQQKQRQKHQLIPPAKVACPHSVRNGKVIQAPGFGYYRFMLGRSVRRFVARRRKDEAGLAEKQRDKIAFEVSGAQ